MENISIADIATLVGIVLLIWQKFFSKGDKQKLVGENNKLKAEAIKTEAEADKVAADTADKYEDVISKLLNRNTEQDKLLQNLTKRVTELEKDNRKLKRQLSKRDANIDFLEIKHRELAQKAIDAGVEGITLEVPCFKFDDEEEF